MLALAGKYADGWWPTGSDRPEEFANKLAVIHRAAQGAGRDPSTITPGKMVMCLLGERDELREMIQRPMVKSLGLTIVAFPVPSGRSAERPEERAHVCDEDVRHLHRREVASAGELAPVHDVEEALGVGPQ